MINETSIFSKNIKQNINTNESRYSFQERESLAEKKYYRQKEIHGYKASISSREEYYLK